VFTAALLSSCSNHESEYPHPYPQEGEHGDALEPLAYTIYTDKTELFVEFKPLIIGETSKFAAHFTVLGENFEAITEGSVSVRLVGSKKQPTNKADGPSSPGIFRLALKPENIGDYKLIFDIQTKDYSDKIVIDNITVYPNRKFAIANKEEEGEEEITYLKEQAWKVEFANVEVKRQPFAEIIKTTGQILSAHGDEVIIIAKLRLKFGF